MHRSKRAVGLDLKAPDGVETFLRLVESRRRGLRGVPSRRRGAARDRPGAVHGPEPPPRVRTPDRVGPVGSARRRRPATTSTTSRSPARWSRSGRAGQAPTPPINVLADFAGGGMLLAFGVAAALFERERSGARPGDRRGDGRRRGADAHPVLRARGRRARGGRGARTCSTPARRSTTPTRPATAGGSRSARSNRSSTPRCSTGWASPTRTSPASWTRPAGRSCEAGSPR